MNKPAGSQYSTDVQKHIEEFFITRDTGASPRSQTTEQNKTRGADK